MSDEQVVAPETPAGPGPLVALVLEVCYERPLRAPVIRSAIELAKAISGGAVAVVAHPDALAEVMGPTGGTGPGGRHHFKPGDRLALQVAPDAPPIPLEAQRITQGQIRLVLQPRVPGRDLIRVYEDAQGLLQVTVDIPDGRAAAALEEGGHEAIVFEALANAHNALEALMATCRRGEGD